MSNEILGDRGKALEELFFARENEKFRQVKQEKDDAENRKAALSAASGISDDTVLDQFIALNLSSDSLTALSLVPLVEVAWADGNMDVVARDNLKKELLCRARTVAESAGGTLGFGKISKEEESKLKELAGAF